MSSIDDSVADRQWYRQIIKRLSFIGSRLIARHMEMSFERWSVFNHPIVLFVESSSLVSPYGTMLDCMLRQTARRG